MDDNPYLSQSKHMNSPIRESRRDMAKSLGKYVLVDGPFF
jgi:hypothetical protein